MDLSIILVNYNTADVTCACIESILRQRFTMQYEIIVVDNGSVDASVTLIRERFPAVRLIENGKNLGFAAGNNVGIRASAGRFVLLLNSDTELLDSGIEGLLTRFDDAPDRGMVTCRLLNSDGSTQYFLRRFPSLLSVIMDTFLLTPLFWRIPALRGLTLLETDYTTARDVQQVAGAFMLMPRAALDELGLLDERFFMYYEDVDLCYRLQQKALRAFFTPEVQIMHHAGKTFRLHRVAATSQRLVSKAAYFQKHQPKIAGLVRLLVTIELLWRTLVAALLALGGNSRHKPRWGAISASFSAGLTGIWRG